MHTKLLLVVVSPAFGCCNYMYSAVRIVGEAVSGDESEVPTN